MGKKFSEISESIKKFILDQKIFFVGTATQNSRINVSPKGMDSFRVLDSNRVVWLNFTGSGNETSAHVQEDGRMTIMFTSFEDKPLILRLYGQAKAHHPGSESWEELISLFGDELLGARQIFDMHVDLVQTSCGFGVPYYNYTGERTILTDWSRQKGEGGIKDYWEEKNTTSIDGKPIHFPAES